jgi:hypothetical protein
MSEMHAHVRIVYWNRNQLSSAYTPMTRLIGSRRHLTSSYDLS